MSLTMNMVGGGGSGIPGNRAVLVARIPSGSTVTATKGGVVLTPMMWVSETYPDQDIALFVFTPAQFDSVNPWTITATDGTNTASDTVLIATNKEYEVELSYLLYLYKDGVSNTDVIGSWSNQSYYCTVTFDEYRITFVQTDRGGHAALYTANKISLVNRTKLCVDADPGTTSSNFGLTSSIANWRPPYETSSGYSTTGRQTKELDVSDYNKGQYHIVLKYYNGAKIFQVWLE